MNLPRFRTLALACLLLPAAAHAGPLRIMTWDIEDGCPAEKFDLLARTVKDRKIDLLALQNVPVGEPAGVEELLEAALDKTCGTGVYRIARSKTSRQDANVVVWNTRTVTAASFREIQLDERSGRALRPLLVFEGRAGGFAFTLVNANLYKGVDEGDDLKLGEADRLGRFIQKLSGKDQSRPVILAGNLDLGLPGETVRDEVFDEDEKVPNPAYRRLNQDGFLKFCTQDIARKDKRAFSYVGDVLESGRLVDHIAANEAAWSRYEKDSARVIRIDKKNFDDLDDYEWNFSDHLPVTAVFETK